MRLRETFEAQFEFVAGDKYLYRRNQKGELIPVTADERARFIRQYMRRVRFIMAGLIAALLIFQGVGIWWMVSRDGDVHHAGPFDISNAVPFVGDLIIAGVAVFLMHWVRGAAARELEGRMPVGRERSKEEMRAIFFRQMSYGYLTAVAAGGVFLVLTHASNDDFHSGSFRIFLSLGVLLVLVACVQAFRKWRFERENS
jgi:hypothetical protein